jgi:alpha-galactosidase
VTTIDIAAGELRLRYEPDAEGKLRQIGFRVIPEGAIPEEGSPIERGPFPPEAFPLAYPAWGEETGAVTALRLDGHDGRPGCYLTLTGYEQDGQEHRIRLADAQASVKVTLCLRCWDADQVLEQWTEIRHQQPGPITLHEVAAAAPVVPASRPWLTRYSGDWAGEWQPATGELPLGVTIVQSFGAVRPHLQAAPFFQLGTDGAADETGGSAIAGALAWGGGIRLAFERNARQPGQLRVIAGHNPAQGPYRLDPGVTFRTPAMIWAWSERGTRPLSQRLHRWVRAHALRDGSRLRPVVFNTWEATYFRFDQASLTAMMAGAAGLGAELFLLDDGWFGTEFPRDDDDAGLGDWQPDPVKLPGGIGALTAAARGHGLRFGLWVEPEMVNPASVLYREHPDWVTGEPGRPRRLDRNQLVLDLCQPPVRDFAAGAVHEVLTTSPDISYLKWDANRDISEPGSAALPADRQSNLWIDTILARWQIMAEVARRWPATELMLCASGGGRTDLGTLRWFHEVWLSDNTDALTRLRMQWEASRYLPPQAIAAHVTRWGDQDLAFACAVAMSARFGFDLDPAALSPAELAVCRRAARWYRDVRDLVQLGEMFRLIAPETGRAALGYADAGRRRLVVFGYQLADAAAPGGPCPVAGIDENLDYRVRQFSLTADAEQDISVRSGRELLTAGLSWPLGLGRTAAIWRLDAQVAVTATLCTDKCRSRRG